MHKDLGILHHFGRHRQPGEHEVGREAHDLEVPPVLCDDGAGSQVVEAEPGTQPAVGAEGAERRGGRAIELQGPPLLAGQEGGRGELAGADGHLPDDVQDMSLIQI